MRNYGRLCLFILTFQNVAYTICMRHARSRANTLFSPSSVILTSELLKIIVCVVVLHKRNEFSLLIRALRNPSIDTLKTFIPAIVYIIQNRLLIKALGNIDAATYQVVYQLKLLTTALFSVFILHKTITSLQWVALFSLFFGVVFVEPPKDNGFPLASAPPQYYSLGLLCVFGASILSGFACVYFELLLKNSSKSLWLRNFELALISVVTGAIYHVVFEYEPTTQKTFFYGFDWLVWLLVLLQSFGGLLVAMVMKYTDNMQKGFACSLSIIISCVFSMVFLDVQLSGRFLLGAGLVLFSVLLYTSSAAKVKRCNAP